MLKKRFFKTKDECEVTFEYEDQGANEVVVVCDLNGWRPVTMKKSRKGPFRTKMRFPKEQNIEFRYLVDSRVWANDDSADSYRVNEFGSRNGVLSTEPPA